MVDHSDMSEDFIRSQLNPISSSGGGGGGGQIPQPGRLTNSKTAEGIKMKLLKFNLTLMGVILYITTTLISLRCCHGNLLLGMCRETEK